MCGRYAITLPPEAMRSLFGYAEQPNFPPRYNVAPTQPVPIVRAERAGDGQVSRHFALVRWGILPGFVKDVKAFPLIINARAETLGQKPSFRNAVRRRRCLFIMDGYYEWRRLDNARPQPFLIRRADHQPMGVAGLWEQILTPDGSQMETACLITTDANSALCAIHDRMPVILSPGDFSLWLDPDEQTTGEALALMQPAPVDLMEFFAVGDAVNKVGNDRADVQAPRQAKALFPDS